MTQPKLTSAQVFSQIREIAEWYIDRVFELKVVFSKTDPTELFEKYEAMETEKFRGIMDLQSEFVNLLYENGETRSDARELFDKLKAHVDTCRAVIPKLVSWQYPMHRKAILKQLGYQKNTESMLAGTSEEGRGYAFKCNDRLVKSNSVNHDILNQFDTVVCPILSKLNEAKTHTEVDVLERFDQLFQKLWWYRIEDSWPTHTPRKLTEADIDEIWNNVSIAFNAARKFVNKTIQKHPDRFDVKVVDTIFDCLQDDYLALLNNRYPRLFNSAIHPQLVVIQSHFQDYLKLKSKIQDLP